MSLSVFHFAFIGCTKKSEDTQNIQATTPAPPTTITVTATPSGNASAAAVASTTAQASPGAIVAGAPIDLNVDAAGFSKSVFIMKTSKGTIKFKLYAKDAPNSSKRLAELVQQKFYNGLTFHRVVPGFVVQTGDPKSKNKNDATIGTGGSGQKLKAEFNSRKHIRGTVAMARAVDEDSADSQFYITLGTFTHLDNKYTVVGQVVDFGEKASDKDVLDRIGQGDEVVDLHIE